MILLDPPYWRQKRGKYPKGKDSFSEVDLDGFNCKMEKLIRDCFKTMKSGGHVALLIQNTTEFGEEMEKAGRYYADHVFDCYRFFVEAGFAPVQRINVPLSWEQFAGFDIHKAKEERRLLGVVRDLLIYEEKSKIQDGGWMTP